MDHSLPRGHEEKTHERDDDRSGGGKEEGGKEGEGRKSAKTRQPPRTSFVCSSVCCPVEVTLVRNSRSTINRVLSFSSTKQATANCNNKARHVDGTCKREWRRIDAHAHQPCNHMLKLNLYLVSMWIRGFQHPQVNGPQPIQQTRTRCTMLNQLVTPSQKHGLDWHEEKKGTT
jgi:hypothetical protein